MIEYSVYDNKVVFSLNIASPLCDEDWEQLGVIYREERKKYIDKKLAQSATNTKDAPKVNLDTSELDAAISKADKLISKLKTAQELINNFTGKAGK